MNNEIKTSHTLFHWPQGFYPRRVSYYLLLKGLVAWPSDLYRGKSQDASLNIKVILFDPEKHVLFPQDPKDPKPADKSTPCLRIADLTTGTVDWIHESSAIPLYLEEVYVGLNALQGSSPLERGELHDIIFMINSAEAEGSNYLRHASSVACKYMGLPNVDRSPAAARNGKTQMVNKLSKVQLWASKTLDSSGWLTPGIERPGIADACLAAWARYMELAYEFDIFAHEDLGPLKEWYQKFKGLSWWKELEEGEYKHPQQMNYQASIDEVDV